MKILLLSPNQIHRYNWGHQLFRNELSNHAEVFYYGPGYSSYNKNLNISDVIKTYGPFDCLLTYGLRYTEQFNGLDDVKIKKAHIIIDYFPSHEGGYKGSWKRQHKFFKKNKFDLFFVRQTRQLPDLKRNGIQTPAYLLPFSVDVDVYKHVNKKKIYDVMTSSTKRRDVYPNRTKIDKTLSKNGLKIMNKRITHETYINSINSSKIFLISNNVFGTLTMKYTEAMSCGAFVLADRPEGFKKLGFVDGKHLVLYNGINDLIKKYEYYLYNEQERSIISKQGMKFVRNKYNNMVWAKYLINTMKKEFIL